MQKPSSHHALTMALVTALLSGAACASIPNAQIGYYGTKWEAAVTVTQTIGCSANNKILSSYYSPDIKVRFSSDYDQHHTLNIKKLSRWYANSDFTISFYDHGRLKSIGQSTIGQGETYVKHAITIASAVAKAAGIKGDDPTESICQYINQVGDKKPITLTYGIAPQDSITTAPQTVILRPTGASAPIVQELESRRMVATPTLLVERVDRNDTAYGGAREIDRKGDIVIRQPTDKQPLICDDAIYLFLQDTETVKLTLGITDVAAGNQIIGSGEFVVPKKNSFYSIPILKAKLFGKQTFNLKLTEAGAIDTLGYGMEAGGTGLMNALASAAKAESDILSSKAADEKAKADILANQHRLVVCETKPADCK